MLTTVNPSIFHTKQKSIGVVPQTLSSSPTSNPERIPVVRRGSRLGITPASTQRVFKPHWCSLRDRKANDIFGKLLLQTKAAQNWRRYCRDRLASLWPNIFHLGGASNMAREVFSPSGDVVLLATWGGILFLLQNMP